MLNLLAPLWPNMAPYCPLMSHLWALHPSPLTQRTCTLPLDQANPPASPLPPPPARLVPFPCVRACSSLALAR